MWESGDQKTPMWLGNFSEMVQRWMCSVGLCAIESLVHFSSTRHQLLQMFTLTVWLNTWHHNYMIFNHHFPAMWCTTTLGTACSLVSKWNISRPVDWKKWPNSVVTSFIKYHFLCGYVKASVYRTKVRDITNLKQRITDAIATIDEGMLQRTWQEKSSSVLMCFVQLMVPM